MTLRPVLLALALLTAAASLASAQSAPPIGVRAAGMGGAFTAIADDGTAPFWNPAGLASGAFTGLTLDGNTLDRQSGLFAGLATPPLGLCYYRTASTALPANDRNGPVVTSAIHHAGVTLVQSLGDHGFAVGSTLKFVHGNGANAFDADAGVMVSGSLAQVGVAVHNLFAPSLDGARLERRVRGGVAIHLRQDLTAAGDVEFTTVNSPVGEWRDAALGIESHPASRAWLRGGVHWNTAGSAAAPIGSIGASYAIVGSLRADAQASFGSKDGDRGWGVGLSFVY
jgi:hypothetical protein